MRATLAALSLLAAPSAGLQLGAGVCRTGRGMSARTVWPVCAAEPEKRVDLSQQGGAIVTAADAEQVGNLVADDEWLGLAMELAIVVS